MIEISIDPRQPVLFEKKNMGDTLGAGLSADAREPL
jgi:hypothetical protein